MHMDSNRLDNKVMPFEVRPMISGDIKAVNMIEKNALSPLVSPTSFSRELRNPRARYLIANIVETEVGDHDELQNSNSPNFPFVKKIWDKTRDLFDKKLKIKNNNQSIAGYIGTWFAADEAHIISVAVHSRFRGIGVGELLLLSGIEQASALGAEKISLEVRVSNFIAQNLYKKYGFKIANTRQGYYIDNREDAYTMIRSESEKMSLKQLSDEHTRKWGETNRRYC